MRHALLLLLLGLASPAGAERPLPSFQDRLGVEAWFEVNAHLDKAGRLRADQDPERAPALARDLERQAQAELRQAIDRAEGFESQVAATSGLAYLRGLAWRLLGDDSKAEAAWRQSIAQDPEGAVDAWHDLGELLIARQAWDEADAAFASVSSGLTSGPQAWRGPLRRAEVAAWRGDAPTLEQHLEEALRRGFRMEQLRGQPQWRIFLAAPSTHDVVEKMVSVYGDRELLLELQRP